MVKIHSCAVVRFFHAVLFGCIFLNREACAESHQNERRFSSCPATDIATVTTEAELRREIMSPIVGTRTIVLNTTELRLRKTLSIKAAGICLEGATTGTVVHCPEEGDASAMVVSAENATLALLNFTGCRRRPAVVVKNRHRNERAMSVTFQRIDFSDNGEKNATNDGAAVKVDVHDVVSVLKNSVRFIQCHFHRNQARFGGAVFSNAVDIHFETCTFEANVAEKSGGAIFFDSTYGNVLEMKRSTFRRNVAGRNTVTDVTGKGMWKSNGKDEENSIVGMGGAVFAKNPTGVQIEATSFTLNKGCRGGGAVAVIHGEILQHNVSDAAGFLVEGSSFRKNRGFCGNSSGALRFDALMAHEVSLGGALRMASSSSSSSGDTSSIAWCIRNASFLGNKARGGGAISFQSHVPSSAVHKITSCTFDRNIALMNGGAIVTARIQLTLAQSNLTNGRSLIGAGIHAFRGSELRFVSHPDEPLATSIIEDNEAGIGGGIYASDCALDLAALILRNNVAHFTGGGIRSEDTAEPVVLRGVTISGNRSPIGGGGAFVAVFNMKVTTSHHGKPTEFHNNSASVGGGLHYDCSDASYFFFTMEGARFVANRALPLSDPEMSVLVNACRDFNPLPGKPPPSHHHLEHLDSSTDFVKLYSHSSQGHGGGLSLTFVSLKPYAIAEVALRNLNVTNNEAVVGGGISAEMKRHYWNKENRTVSCLSATLGYDACQRFEMHNVKVTKNKAQYAGGIFTSHPNGIAFKCGHNFSETCLAGNLSYLADGSEPRPPISSRIEENECLGSKTGQSSQIGTRTATLFVVGGKRHLRRVASGENVDLPCDPESEANCTCDDTKKNCRQPLRIFVKDAFNQTIDGGIDDANLTISLFSPLIVGNHRYTAKNGVVTIDRTRTWGIDRNCTFMIQSERDDLIEAQLDLHTRECYPGESMKEDVCDKCLVEQYGFNASLGECHPCEAHAECSGGAVLIPQEGYWHSTPFSPVFHKCIYRDACRYEGRRRHLEEFYADPKKLQTQLTAMEDATWDSDDVVAEYEQCATGYGGPLCGSCQHGYGHSYTGECEACLENCTASHVRFVVAAAWLFFLIGTNCAITLMSTDARVALAKYELRTRACSQMGLVPPPTPVYGYAVESSRVLNQLSGVSDKNREVTASIQPFLAQQLVATVLLTETLKILINYLQVTGTALRLQTDWSGPLQRLLQIQASLVGSLTATVSTPYECGFRDNGTPASVVALWMKLTTPFMAVLALLVVFVLVWSFRKMRDMFRQASGNRRRSAFWEPLLTYTIVISVVSLHLIYIDVVRELLRTVNCVDMATDTEDMDRDHPYIMYAKENVRQYVWAEDTQLTCFQHSHLPLGIAGVVGLIAAFLIIIVIILWLPLNKKHIRKTIFISRYWFLFQGYRSQWYTVAWESTILARKSAIAAVAVFTVHMTPSLQASICAGVLTISLALQAFFVPFKIPEDHQNVPDYGGALFVRLGMPKLGKRWLSFHNAVHLNVLETASLAASASVFYTAIVLDDTTSSSLGRWLITFFSFAFNVVFLVFLVYRLYCGLHIVLDFKLQLVEPNFLATHQNSLNIGSLFRKAHALIRILKNPAAKVRNELDNDDDDDVECQMTFGEHIPASFVCDKVDFVQTEGHHLHRSASI